MRESAASSLVAVSSSIELLSAKTRKQNEYYVLVKRSYRSGQKTWLELKVTEKYHKKPTFTFRKT